MGQPWDSRVAARGCASGAGVDRARLSSLCGSWRFSLVVRLTTVASGPSRAASRAPSAANRATLVERRAAAAICRKPVRRAAHGKTRARRVRWAVWMGSALNAIRTSRRLAVRMGTCGFANRTGYFSASPAPTARFAKTARASAHAQTQASSVTETRARRCVRATLTFQVPPARQQRNASREVVCSVCRAVRVATG
jgi:hypothetical protein